MISNINVNALSNAIYLSWPEPPSNGSEILSYNVELEDCVYNTEENVLELYLEDLSPETQYRYFFSLLAKYLSYYQSYFLFLSDFSNIFLY